MDHLKIYNRNSVLSNNLYETMLRMSKYKCQHTSLQCYIFYLPLHFCD